MKILIIQLARLGDILLVGPAINALKRQHPGCSVHMLVRKKFSSAARVFEVDEVIELDTKSVLEPLMQSPEHLEASLKQVDCLLAQLQGNAYDRVINLTFSPVSSWLTSSLENSKTQISGYTRHHDGWLQISDAVSSYFYAQVGPGRPNRIHLSDLFAAICDVDLVPDDWRVKNLTPTQELKIPQRAIILHCGASEAHKRVLPFQWGRMIKKVLQSKPELSFVLIGSEDEKKMAEEIIANAGQNVIVNLCGATKFEELFSVMRQAELLIGADSSPVHIASLVGLKTLNMSVGEVNFWETGPKASGSQVIRLEKATDFSSDEVSEAVMAILANQTIPGAYQVQKGLPSFLGETQSEVEEFNWKLAAALYLEAPFPMAEEMGFLESIAKLREMNQVLLEQLQQTQLDDQRLGILIDGADQVFEKLAQMNSSCAIYVRWLMTERAKIPPGQKSQTRQKMHEIHALLEGVTRPYDMDKVEGSL